MRKDVGSGPEDYLELEIASASLKIMVPERSLRDVGVRDLSTRQEAERLLAVLEEPSDVPERWAERNTFTVARMKSTDLDQKCMVVRDLIRHAQSTGKPLSMAEHRALDTCLDIVSDELSLALGISGEETKALMVERAAVQADQETRESAVS